MQKRLSISSYGHFEATNISSLRGYLIAGVLVSAPITITAWLTIAIVNFVDSQVEGLIPPQYNPENYMPFSVPGLGFVAMILFLILGC